MTTVSVVNVRGVRGPDRAGVCYVGRPFAGWPGHALGNPFRPKSYGNGAACQTAMSRWQESQLAECLGKYRVWLAARPSLESDLAALWEETQCGAKPLGCWCVSWDGTGPPPMVCHAVILAQMLNDRFGGQS